MRLDEVVLLNFRSRAMIFNDSLRLLFIPLSSDSTRCRTHAPDPVYEASEFIFDSCARRQSVNFHLQLVIPYIYHYYNYIKRLFAALRFAHSEHMRFNRNTRASVPLGRDAGEPECVYTSNRLK